MGRGMSFRLPLGLLLLVLLVAQQVCSVPVAVSLVATTPATAAAAASAATAAPASGASALQPAARVLAVALSSLLLHLRC